jgi:hypothetical protein
MPTLVDSSIYNALARYRLLDEGLAVRGITRADIFVLKELKWQLKDNKDKFGKPILDPASLQVAKDFYDDVRGAPPQPLQIIDPRWVDPSDLQLLDNKWVEIWHGVKRVKVDGGEAVLFACSKNLANFSIWTSDIKSLIALGKHAGYASIHGQIAGKVYCLERMIRDLVQAYGFGPVSSKIVAHVHSIDDAMKQGQAGCGASLLAAEAQLRTDCNGLLVP